MKKTLAIVLALAMVLCMMPAAFANTTKTITDKSYTITVYEVGAAGAITTATNLGTASAANSVEAKYNFETQEADVTGKFTEDKKMAVVIMSGFDAAFNGKDATVTIDGKSLDLGAASYAGACGWSKIGNNFTFPVELTKAGYSDTYLISVKATVDGVDITETAKITVKFVNTASYKDAETATISEIVGTNVDAYIVGSKIYLDYPSAKNDTSKIKLTFKDENGAKFSAVTWAYAATSKTGAQNSIFSITAAAANNQFTDGVKLDGSAASYMVWGASASDDQKTDVIFELETASKLYETKKYGVVVRENITEEDPKGIYFAETTKTIKRGESFTPVVMGVATGKALPYRDGVSATSSLTIDYGTGTSKQCIDVEDHKTVVGTMEGVAYITASYTTNIAGKAPYTSSSMKVIVTAGDAIDPTAATTYTVTCRVLNVRKGAGTSFAKAGKATRGTKLSVVSINNGWAQLADGTFVCAKYIAK